MPKSGQAQYRSRNSQNPDSISSAHTNSVRVPSDPNVRKSVTERSVEDLLHKDTVDRARKVTGKLTEGVKTAKNAAGSVLGSLGDITKLGLNKTTGNPSWVTALAAGGGLIAGVKSIKNVLKGFSNMLQPMQDPKLGWFPYLLEGVLQGGLFFGLTSAFLGRKNLFAEQIDGKNVVKVKTLIGAAIAPFLLSIFMGLAQGTSVFRKIPIIGPSLAEICETVFGAGRAITVPTGEGQGQGGPGGIPGQG